MVGVPSAVTPALSGSRSRPPPVPRRGGHAAAPPVGVLLGPRDADVHRDGPDGGASVGGGADGMITSRDAFASRRPPGVTSHGANRKYCEQRTRRTPRCRPHRRPLRAACRDRLPGPRPPGRRPRPAAPRQFHRVERGGAVPAGRRDVLHGHHDDPGGLPRSREAPLGGGARARRALRHHAGARLGDRPPARPAAAARRRRHPGGLRAQRYGLQRGDLPGPRRRRAVRLRRDRLHAGRAACHPAADTAAGRRVPAGGRRVHGHRHPQDGAAAGPRGRRRTAARGAVRAAGTARAALAVRADDLRDRGGRRGGQRGRHQVGRGAGVRRRRAAQRARSGPRLRGGTSRAAGRARQPCHGLRGRHAELRPRRVAGHRPLQPPGGAARGGLLRVAQRVRRGGGRVAVAPGARPAVG